VMSDWFSFGAALVQVGAAIYQAVDASNQYDIEKRNVEIIGNDARLQAQRASLSAHTQAARSVETMLASRAASGATVNVPGFREGVTRQTNLVERYSELEASKKALQAKIKLESRASRMVKPFFQAVGAGATAVDRWNKWQNPSTLETVEQRRLRLLWEQSLLDGGNADIS
jgi:hypothetical protein